VSGVEPVVLARLGETVDEVVVIEWLVEVGAAVQMGDALVRVETDKIEVDVESPFAGTVTEFLVEAGDDVATGATICRIDTSG
jgi:2-oxoglutarate dehydrogenase E2 component (dihydrolipoamide succinyltransferase)